MQLCRAWILWLFLRFCIFFFVRASFYFCFFKEIWNILLLYLYLGGMAARYFGLFVPIRAGDALFFVSFCVCYLLLCEWIFFVIALIHVFFLVCGLAFIGKSTIVQWWSNIIIIIFIIRRHEHRCWQRFFLFAMSIRLVPSCMIFIEITLARKTILVTHTHAHSRSMI